jgi:hypothetical protein
MYYYYGVVSAMPLQLTRSTSQQWATILTLGILSICWSLLCGLLVSTLAIVVIRLDITARTLPLVIKSIPIEWFLVFALLCAATVALLRQLPRVDRSVVGMYVLTIILVLCTLSILAYYYPNQAESLIHSIWWYRTNPLTQLRHEVLQLVFR